MKIFYVGGTSGKKFEAASYERILAEDTAIWWRSDPGARVGPDTAEVEQVNDLKGTRQWAVPRPKKKRGNAADLLHSDNLGKLGEGRTAAEYAPDPSRLLNYSLALQL